MLDSSNSDKSAKQRVHSFLEFTKGKEFNITDKDLTHPVFAKVRSELINDVHAGWDDPEFLA